MEEVDQVCWLKDCSYSRAISLSRLCGGSAYFPLSSGSFSSIIYQTLWLWLRCQRSGSYYS